MGPPGVQRKNELAADLAGLEARRADVDALRGALNHSAYTLDVGIETTLRASVRVGDVVAEARSLAAHITDRSHGELLLNQIAWTFVGVLDAFVRRQPLKNSRSPATDANRQGPLGPRS